MQKQVDISEKIAVEFDLENAFQVLLAMTDIMSSINSTGLGDETIAFYAIAINDLTRAIQKHVIG